MHVGRQRFRVGRDARVTGFNATLGGDLVRIYTTATYDGPGGDAELLGVFFADEGQHLEHRLFVDHEAPSCRSDVAYKGALQGKGAHSVWIGDVLIRAAAVGTDTYELNRNLLLTDGARADSVPNLEIETGEIVGAGHASATGRFDDEQLFYLQSRGITEKEARQLVVRGFFADVVGRLGVPEVEERLTAAIEAELVRAEADCGMSPQPVASLVRARRSTPRKRVEVGDLTRLPSCAPRTASAPSTTSAATPRSRCPRARSTARPSSAGCTARASTSHRASRSGLPATQPVPVYPVTIDGDAVLVDVPVDVTTH